MLFVMVLCAFWNQEMACLSPGDGFALFWGDLLPRTLLLLVPPPFSFFLFSLSNKKEKREKESRWLNQAVCFKSKPSQNNHKIITVAQIHGGKGHEYL